MKISAYTLTFLSAAQFLCAGDKELSTEQLDSKVPVEIETDPIPEWGVLMGMRYAQLPFKADDKGNYDIFPLFYYEGDHFFLRGDYGGLKLWEGEKLGLNAIARYRFYDIPEEYDSGISGGGADMGVQAFWKLDENSQIQVEALSDQHGNVQGQVRWAGDYRKGLWRLFPELELRATGSDYNTRYYGLEQYDLDASLEARARLKARRRVWSDLFIEGRLEGGWIGSEAGASPLVEDDFEWEAYVGLGLFQEERDHMSDLKAKPYWRISQGFGTASDFQEIPLGNFETDDGADVMMTSIFYGLPLSDTLFGAPWQVYLTPGVVYNYSSDVQDSSFEFVLAFKAYYTFPTPWRLRLGLAEGISYADSLTYYEYNELEEDGDERSQLLNYLDVSLDLNIGDVFNNGDLDGLWLGTGIHHRSGIYGTSSAFGDLSGGVNFLSVYLQWHGDF
ncbi:MipA/OmpV family protein [Rubritalea spongiae]|uniref:MipA/OmpV family protein n=1 Tax=Rubritalea spongiae TaxID=430797 RepID=A0ABW5E3C8_9BACT